MSDELKPCPFCGETYIIQGTFEFRGDGPDKFPNDIVCSGCGIGYCGHDFKGQGEAAVVAAWNRRADADEIDRLRGVLAVKDHALNIAWGRIRTIDAQKLEVVANNDDVISIINAALADGEGVGSEH